MSAAPVLVLAFNRPAATERALAALRAAGPERVFFAVDGPRPDRQGEAASVARVHSLVEQLDWGCTVETLFRPQNLGCKLAVSQAIAWFFSHVEAGIILEDDCVADPSFFPYAAELLARFADDERVLMVSGDNFQQARGRTNYSYYFSRYAHIWGWASWRRAWRLYDYDMRAWPQRRDGDWLVKFLGNRMAAAYWSAIFEDTYRNRNTSWAYRWMFCVWLHGGLTILPNVNLVSNIGFADTATHTRERNHRFAALPTQPMAFPLRHPPSVVRDARADAFTQRHVFSSPPAWRRLAGAVRRTLALR